MVFEFLAVVGEERDDRRSVEPGLLQGVEHVGDVSVGEVDLPVVEIPRLALSEGPGLLTVVEVLEVGIEVVDEQKERPCGVALLAPSLSRLAVSEYAANSVKKSVVGKGHADKHQVQAMVKVLLPKCGELASDEADALAVAICHAHHGGMRRLEAS